MRRRALNAAAAVSTVLCLALATLCVDSYKRGIAARRSTMQNIGVYEGGNTGGELIETKTFGMGWYRGWLVLSYSRHYSDTRSMDVPAPDGSLKLTPDQPLDVLWQCDVSAGWLEHELLRSRGEGPLRWRRDTREMLHMSAHDFEVAIRLWTICLLSGLVPCLIAMRRLNLSEGPELCAICGYDLRATADRCPECGTALPAGMKA